MAALSSRIYERRVDALWRFDPRHGGTDRGTARGRLVPMKRRGCIDCHLIEPTPGLWIAGRCPNCAELHRLRQERQPDAPAAKAVKDEALAATAIRLQGYLARIAEQYPNIWRQIDRMRAE